MGQTFPVASYSQTVRLTLAWDETTKLPLVKVEGPAGVSASIQVASQFSGSSWTTLETFSLGSAPYQYLDRQATRKWPRFYRVKTDTAPAPPLTDLSLSPNSVFVPGEGFDTVQYAPNGKLGFIFWRNRDLMIRERTGAVDWVEQAIASDGNIFSPVMVGKFDNFQPAAILLYDASSTPHVFRLSSGSSIAHYTRGNNGWTRAESIAISGASSITRLVGALGANDIFHLGAVGDGGNLVHGTRRSGQWQWSTVAQIGADPYWTPGSYTRRWFSMAVDSRNAAHFVYRPAFTMDKPGGYPLAYTELAYASDRSGQWTRQIVRKPDDNSGEVGSGQSIAIGPDDQPCIASWYNERGPGGSAQWSRLQYFQMTGAGTWTRSEVISRPDAYISGDGEKGTGVEPYLRFDARGRAHILFLDHASEHFPYQNEYAGHIRHAWWDGGRWAVESVFRQDKPLQQQVLFPAFAMSANEMSAIGLERLTTSWNVLSNPQVAASTYKFIFFSKALP